MGKLASSEIVKENQPIFIAGPFLLSDDATAAFVKWPDDDLFIYPNFIPNFLFAYDGYPNNLIIANFPFPI